LTEVEMKRPRTTSTTWLALLLVISLLALAACGDDGEIGDGTTTAAPTTTTTVTSPSPTNAPTSPPAAPPTEAPTSPPPPPPIAATCGDIEAVLLAVFSGPDVPAIAEVRVSECANGYARTFFVPVESGFETEQVFLIDRGGAWEILDFGTGLDCADIDLMPDLEAACVALGLR
jgi:hypothetical protein